jgi:uncharacterized iron-regulated protein
MEAGHGKFHRQPRRAIGGASVRRLARQKLVRFMKPVTLCRPLLACGALAAAAALIVLPASGAATTNCVPIAGWVSPGPSGAQPIAAAELLARMARQSVVLLGEEHENADHHRWQLQTLIALHALRPDMVLGFEMFPRRVQPALERWVGGELTETEFLAAAEWRSVWNVDAQLYLPIFHFARMNRVPMVALNVDRELTRAVNAKGFDGVPAAKREGITRPAAPTDAYLDFLLPIYTDHDRPVRDAEKVDRNDPAFRRFVDSQQLWDRAIAQGITVAAARQPAPLVVAILGAGHVANGFGVPHQLRDLGVTKLAWLLPWERGGDCSRLTAGYADAVFGMATGGARDEVSRRPRLGVLIETVGDGVRIQRVGKGSIAEAAGIRAGDIISAAAGVPVKEMDDLRAAVQRQAPGTWLPLKVLREGDTLDIIAKFPPATP